MGVDLSWNVWGEAAEHRVDAVIVILAWPAGFIVSVAFQLLDEREESWIQLGKGNLD